MVSTHKKARAVTVVADDDQERGFPWLEGALAVSAVALFFQLFPGVWATAFSFLALVFSYIDVRGWTWRSYAVVISYGRHTPKERFGGHASEEGNHRTGAIGEKRRKTHWALGAGRGALLQSWLLRVGIGSRCHCIWKASGNKGCDQAKNPDIRGS